MENKFLGWNIPNFSGSISLRFSGVLVKWREKEKLFDSYKTWPKYVLSFILALMDWVLVFFKQFECRLN